MSQDIPKHNKLLVVSDTGMFIDSSQNNIKGFGPVVRELDYFSTIFDEITWIGFHKEEGRNNSSYTLIDTTKIKVIALNEVGGKRFVDKLKIIWNYPFMFFTILSEVFNHTMIHSRAPSNPSVIIMLISCFFRRKIFWHKYAGNWKGKASYFYKVQRTLLKKLPNNSFITVNGEWQEKNTQILAFENPCLTVKDRAMGNEVVLNKRIEEKLEYCFVGGLNKNKGIDELIQVYSVIKSDKIGTLHVVGDGNIREALEEVSKKSINNIKFYGFLGKEAITSVYKKCHFIVLPSKSEGFPKVIGEAMNYGCIPIVSAISCIPQYIKPGYNGFLIDPLLMTDLKKKLEKSLGLSSKAFKNYFEINYQLAEKFTYTYYIERIQKDIINNA